MEEAERRQAEKTKEQAQPVITLDVPQAILLSISLLTDLAWQKMGLHINPSTKQIEKDFKQARLAIDTISLLIEMIKEHISQREYDLLRTTLTNLKLNFAEQVRRSEP